MILFFRRIIARIKTFKMKREIARNFRLNKTLDLAKFFAEQAVPPKTETIDPTAFPGIDRRLEGFSAAISGYAKARQTATVPQNVHIQIGDSLSDFFRGKSSIIDPRMNFGIAGTCSPHFGYVAEKLAPVLAACNLLVTTVTVGCFLGNALLGYQDFDEAVADAKRALGKIRTLWPKARIEIYGLPACFDPYVTLHQELARKFFVDLVQADSNAVYLDLLESFGGGFLGLFPRMELSSDTVHMTPEAQVDFDLMIGAGVNCPAGRTIVYRGGILQSY